MLPDLNGFSAVTSHISTKIDLQIESIITRVINDLLIYLNDKKRDSLPCKQHQVRSPILMIFQKLPVTSDMPVQGCSSQLSCICKGGITQSY